MPSPTRTMLAIFAGTWLGMVAFAGGADAVPVDLSGYRADCGVEVHRDGDGLAIRWPTSHGEFGRLALDLRPGRALIAGLGLDAGDAGGTTTLLRDVDPATFVVVGTREGTPGRPPEMSPFNEFFDAPAKRPHMAHQGTLDLRRARVTSHGRRATIALGEFVAGPFAGELEITVYPGARLVHVEAVVSTRNDRCAFLYDAGLVGGPDAGWSRMAWMDTEGTLRVEPLDPQAADRSLAVRHRAVFAECGDGTVACFPPPHQYFFPRDLTDNLRFAWSGRGHRGLADRFGFGIRQWEQGGGSFVPWFNAPPGTAQRLGVFYHLSRGTAQDALREVLRYTHDDRFPELPGYLTFTSHWHMAIAIAAMQRQARGESPVIPDFVRMFKDMGVRMVHLAEFHGDGHPQDPGPLRQPELEAMVAECRRLSDDELLLMPGEEANVYLGINEPGKHPGHWLYFFPKPVYWVMRRAPGESFASVDPKYGTVYHVGSREDLVELLRREHGLAWTAHPRIKASSWTPDIYRREDFYLADTWLGAAWKAMPADLSSPRLGERVLDLFSDMDNWGQKKYVLGEVDVFKLDHTHELYGHMNVNYVRLDRLPKFDEGWQPLLDALRAGRFFVTTGEVLPREFTIGGKGSGETLTMSEGDRPEMRATLDWTFPLRFAELVSGDGKAVYRERIDLSDTEPFGRRTLTLKPDLAGRTWVRLEAWDVAGNGAFTQPIWLEK
jgi:hypothetical protein